MKRSDLYAKALALPQVERLGLAAQLIASADWPPGIIPADDPRHADEIKERARRVKNGEGEGIPWEDVRAAAEAIIELHRQAGAKKTRAKKTAARKRSR